MDCGPAPCLTMCRNPLVFGLAGASRAATPEPEGSALISFVVSPVLCSSTAAARAAAVFTLVARAVRHHQHPALAARRRTLMCVGQLGRGQRCLHRIQRNV